ncbi:hypothetical protein [Mycobacterium riyadhense]|uniref:hypothetical protein n=1 Tax=Mycobacterium riyadhense TaxID=486698 RepID=UPI00195BB197|nr:hypothetical protein [Mycobacterium riyadhense]
MYLRAKQWITLRHVTRLLARLADDDAVFVHCALVKAGKPSPLHAAQLSILQDRLGADRFDAHVASAADGTAAVARARSGLQQFAERTAMLVV